GCGGAAWQSNFCFGRGDGRLRPEVRRGVDAAVAGEGGTGAGAGGLRLRMAEPEQVRAELEAGYRAELPGRPGMFERSDNWWDRVLRTDSDQPDDGEPLRCVLAEDDGGPRGYA